MRTSSGMKNIFEHHFTWFMNHRPQEEMFRKKAVILTNAAGAGMDKAGKDIKVNLAFWGISNIYSLSLQSIASSWKQVPDKNMKKFIKTTEDLAKKVNKSQAGVSFKTKGLFYIMRMMYINNQGHPRDAQYWEEKGWIGKERPWKP